MSAPRLGLPGPVSPGGIASKLFDRTIGRIVGKAVEKALRAGTNEAVRLFFGSLLHWIAQTDRSALSLLWRAISHTTEPVVSGAGFHPELATMTVIAATVALPLLIGAAILAVVRQDPGGLIRTACIRLPLALLFTGAAVELVSLSLSATDAACGALLGAAGDPLVRLFDRLNGAFVYGGPGVLFANGALMAVAGLLMFLVWLELAVRQAAVAVAVLFLPLALVGSTFPGTAHWARRLGETIAALVLSKFVIVAVLALSVSSLGAPGTGIAAVVEAITMLALSVTAPFALLRILPMIESGATGHLEGLGRRTLSQSAHLSDQVIGWLPPRNGPNGSNGPTGSASLPSGIGAPPRSAERIPSGPVPVEPSPAAPRYE